MTKWAKSGKLVLVVLVGFIPILAGPAPAQAAPKANKFAHVSDANNGTTISLSTSPAILGSFEAIASGGAGNVTIWDSPDGTSSHALAVVVAEAGLTADRDSFSSGPINRLTEFGLYVETNLADAIVQWGS